MLERVGGETSATREPNYKSHSLRFEKQRHALRWAGDFDVQYTAIVFS